MQGRVDCFTRRFGQRSVTCPVQCLLYSSYEIKGEAMKLDGKVAVITGSAANIGKATALLFAKEGAKVVVTTKTNVTGGNEVVDQIKKTGGEAIFVKADLAVQDGVDKLFAAALDAFGTVDILVNNAGITKGKPLMESTLEDLRSQYEDNVFSMMLCAQAAAKIMLGKGSGVILNTTSIRGLEHGGRPTAMAYSTAKAATISFTKNLAKELAPNIRVNGVAPGFTLTPNYDQDSPMVKSFIEGTLIKRWIKAEEIAEAFLYLATAEAITGENLVVDGGYTTS
jgi:3-oxoacyl-[acyl-carrier protein] reductase